MVAKYLTAVIIFISFSCFVFPQKKTTEKRVTTDAHGGKDSTESVIISRTEDITPRSNMIIINPLKFILFYNISYYKKLDQSLVLGGSIQTPTLKGINGFGFNAEARIHFNSKAPKGFYLAPNISYNNLRTDGSGSSANAISIGALIGWQWFPGDEFAMGLGIGVDHYFLSNSKNDFSNYNGSAPNIRFDIGYAW